MKYFESTHDLKGNYLSVTGNVEEMIGFTPDELVGTNAYDYFNYDDLIRIVKQHASNISDEDITKRVEYRIRCKGGNYLWVSTVSYREEDILYTKTIKLNFIQVLFKQLGL